MAWRARAGLRGAGRQRTRPRGAARRRRMDSRTNSHRQMRRYKGQWRDQQLAMRPGSNRGRPWPRGHLGGRGGWLHWSARHAFFTSGLVEQVHKCYNSAPPAAPLLIQQGHSVVRVQAQPLSCPVAAPASVPRGARGPGDCGVKYGRATSIAAIDKPLKELHAVDTALARGAAARLERRAPRGPPRGVVRLGPPMVCACFRRRTLVPEAAVLPGGGLCRCGLGRRLGGGWLRRHLHAFCSTHA